LFGRIAQRLIKRTVDALIADNPPRFIPDEITRLLEKVFTFNVSFTENTISSGNVSFQVNAIVAEIDDGNPLPLMPIGSQSSSLVLSQSAGSSVQATPEKDITFTLTSPATRTKRARSPAALQDTESSSLINMVGPVATSPVITGCSTRETEHSATQKRSASCMVGFLIYFSFISHARVCLYNVAAYF
jgi:replication factor A1